MRQLAPVVSTLPKLAGRSGRHPAQTGGSAANEVHLRQFRQHLAVMPPSRTEAGALRQLARVVAQRDRNRQRNCWPRRFMQPAREADASSSRSISPPSRPCSKPVFRRCSRGLPNRPPRQGMAEVANAQRDALPGRNRRHVALIQASSAVPEQEVGTGRFESLRRWMCGSCAATSSRSRPRRRRAHRCRPLLRLNVVIAGPLGSDWTTCRCLRKPHGHIAPASPARRTALAQAALARLREHG